MCCDEYGVPPRAGDPLSVVDQCKGTEEILEDPKRVFEQGRVPAQGWRAPPKKVTCRSGPTHDQGMHAASGPLEAAAARLLALTIQRACCALKGTQTRILMNSGPWHSLPDRGTALPKGSRARHSLGTPQGGKSQAAAHHGGRARRLPPPSCLASTEAPAPGVLPAHAGA